MSLRQVFYVSRPVRRVTTGELRQLAGAAAVANRRAGITGVLAFTGAHFGQLVEGAPAVVERLVSRLQADLRHTGVRVLIDRSGVVQRDFAQWDMHLVDSPGLEEVLAAIDDADVPVPQDVERALQRIAAEARWQSADDIGGDPLPPFTS